MGIIVKNLLSIRSDEYLELHCNVIGPNNFKSVVLRSVPRGPLTEFVIVGSGRVKSPKDRRALIFYEFMLNIK